MLIGYGVDFEHLYQIIRTYTYVCIILNWQNHSPIEQPSQKYKYDNGPANTHTIHTQSHIEIYTLVFISLSIISFYRRFISLMKYFPSIWVIEFKIQWYVKNKLQFCTRKKTNSVSTMVTLFISTVTQKCTGSLLWYHSQFFSIKFALFSRVNELYANFMTTCNVRRVFSVSLSIPLHTFAMVICCNSLFRMY